MVLSLDEGNPAVERAVHQAIDDLRQPTLP